MIFTRRFGALRARRTFPSTSPVMDIKEYEAQRLVEEEAERAAQTQPQPKTHGLVGFHFHRPTRKHTNDTKHAA